MEPVHFSDNKEFLDAIEQIRKERIADKTKSIKRYDS